LPSTATRDERPKPAYDRVGRCSTWNMQRFRNILTAPGPAADQAFHFDQPQVEHPQEGGPTGLPDGNPASLPTTHRPGSPGCMPPGRPQDDPLSEPDEAAGDGVWRCSTWNVQKFRTIATAPMSTTDQASRFDLLPGRAPAGGQPTRPPGGRPASQLAIQRPARRGASCQADRRPALSANLVRPLMVGSGGVPRGTPGGGEASWWR
jgi:hypothetical protein